MSEVNGMKCDGTGAWCGSPGCCPKVASPVQGAASASGEANGAAYLTDAELADPVFVRAYIEGCNDSFAEVLAENVKLRAALALSERQLKAARTVSDKHYHDLLATPAPEQEAAPQSAFREHLANSGAAVEGMPAWKRDMWGEQEAEQPKKMPALYLSVALNDHDVKAIIDYTHDLMAWARGAEQPQGDVMRGKSGASSTAFDDQYAEDPTGAANTNKGGE